jgi:hypothetical protein
MKKECELVHDFDNDEISSVFYAINVAIEQNNWDLLDLELCKVKVNEAFRALDCKKRFDRLRPVVRCNKHAFTLDDHEFETLDEVERALKNKAFL